MLPVYRWNMARITFYWRWREINLQFHLRMQFTISLLQLARSDVNRGEVPVVKSSSLFKIDGGAELSMNFGSKSSMAAWSVSKSPRKWVSLLKTSRVTFQCFSVIFLREGMRLFAQGIFFWRIILSQQLQWKGYPRFVDKNSVMTFEAVDFACSSHLLMISSHICSVATENVTLGNVTCKQCAGVVPINYP